jgi:hypothetical protein
MIEAVERADLRPACPHCATTLSRVCFQRLSGVMGRRYVYFCEHCHKVLGISHRKGFWMG